MREVAELEARMAEPGFWDRPEGAQRTVAALKRAKRTVEDWSGPDAELRHLEELLELEDTDAALLAEVNAEVERLAETIAALETRSLLSGEYDRLGALVSIHPGAGGTESQDWAQMLFRMYLRWAERHGFATGILDLQPGDEAGFKDATIEITGEFAYGHLKGESGVHRLVRISPFDAAKRRHTSFASLDVIPLLEETDEGDVDIDPKDLRIDVYRSTGPGGQSVNTTDSAVRITHLPTGITAACQNERSQLQNRAVAMRILKARLAELERRKLEEKLENIRGQRRGIDFGSQIRSYVLAPYRLVKDHRTNVEIGNVDRVLDGDIDELIEAELRRRAENGEGT